MWRGVMRHNIVFSPPLICTAESEAGQVQRCAQPHIVWVEKLHMRCLHLLRQFDFMMLHCRASESVYLCYLWPQYSAKIPSSLYLQVCEGLWGKILCVYSVHIPVCSPAGKYSAFHSQAFVIKMMKDAGNVMFSPSLEYFIIRSRLQTWGWW